MCRSEVQIPNLNWPVGIDVDIERYVEATGESKIEIAQSGPARPELVACDPQMIRLRAAVDLLSEYPDGDGWAVLVAWALYDCGLSDEAVDTLESLACRQKVPFELFDDAYFNLGWVLAERGKHQEAVGKYNECLQSRAGGQMPKDAGLLSHLGLTYHELGQFEKAIDNYKESELLIEYSETQRVLEGPIGKVEELQCDLFAERKEEDKKLLNMLRWDASKQVRPVGVWRTEYGLFTGEYRCSKS